MDAKSNQIQGVRGGWRTFRLTFRLTLVGRHNAPAPFCCPTTISLAVTPSRHRGTYPHRQTLLCSDSGRKKKNSHDPHKQYWNFKLPDTFSQPPRYMTARPGGCPANENDNICAHANRGGRTQLGGPIATDGPLRREPFDWVGWTCIELSPVAYIRPSRYWRGGWSWSPPLST